MTVIELNEPLPADPDGVNDQRAHWAGVAIDAFQEATGTDREDVLCDLLTDLMHWADRQDFDFEAAFWRAEDHYREETRPVDEPPPAAPAAERNDIIQTRRNSQ